MSTEECLGPRTSKTSLEVLDPHSSLWLVDFLAELIRKQILVH